MILREIGNVLRVNDYYTLRGYERREVFTIRLFFVSMTVYILAYIFAITILATLSELGILEMPQKRHNIEEWSFANLVIATPVFEELQYRSILKYSRKNLSAFLACWGLFFWITIYTPCFPALNFWYHNIIIVLFLYFLVYHSIGYDKRLDRILLALQEKNRIPLIYLSSFVFGLMHLSNFEIEYSSQIIIALPYIASGFIFAFYRIRYGIYASIGMHALNNALAFIFLRL